MIEYTITSILVLSIFFIHVSLRICHDFRGFMYISQGEKLLNPVNKSLYNLYIIYLDNESFHDEYGLILITKF